MNKQVVGCKFAQKERIDIKTKEEGGDLLDKQIYIKEKYASYYYIWKTLYKGIYEACFIY